MEQDNQRAECVPVKMGALHVNARQWDQEWQTQKFVFTKHVVTIFVNQYQKLSILAQHVLKALVLTIVCAELTPVAAALSHQPTIFDNKINSSPI